jgi:flavodoxin
MPQNKELKALIIYWSATGNTEKVAGAIKKALVGAGIEPVVKKLKDAGKQDFFDYDIVFIGSPSYQFLPPEPVQKFMDEKMKMHRERGDVKLCSPRVPGKTAVIFVTFSGPHTGISEATPVGDYLGQFFDHIGFNVAAKWYNVGEFHGHEDFSTKGRLGDIRGRPNEADLAEVEKNVAKLIDSLGDK